MKKRVIAWAAAIAALAAALWGLRLSSGMEPAEAIRKLAGLRMALTLYAGEAGGPPASFGLVQAAGKLEAVPYLKLAWHRGAGTVADVPDRAVRDTGGWAYVNAPGPDFGLLFIDCAHRDPKGRYWSEF